MNQTETITNINLIQASFDYLVYRLAILYSENELKVSSTDSIDKKLSAFNSNNDFGIKKISLYPFIVTIGNGNRSLLLKHFNKNFIPLSFGIVQKDIYQTLQNGAWNSPIMKYESYKTVIQDLNNNEIVSTLATAYNVSVENLQIIAQPIAESIEFITNSKIKNLSQCSLETLSYWSTSGLIYGTYQKYFEDDKAVSNSPDPQNQLITHLFNESIAEANFTLAFS